MTVPDTPVDVGITWDALAMRGDWSISNGDLALRSPLESAVLVSLFSDARAGADFVLPPGETDLRGCWLDSYEATPLGSRYWELARAKKADAAALLLRARDFGNRALQWLVEDGVAASVETTPAWVNSSTLSVTIEITKPDGSVTTFAYARFWTAQGV